MKKQRQFDDGATLSFPITEDGELVDLTGASAEITFKPPGVPSFLRPGSIPSGPAGIVEWEAGPGDLGWWGLWQAQVRTQFAGGTPNVKTSTFTFEVEPILGPPPIYIRPDAVCLVALAPAVART